MSEPAPLADAAAASLGQATGGAYSRETQSPPPRHPGWEELVRGAALPPCRLAGRKRGGRPAVPGSPSAARIPTRRAGSRRRRTGGGEYGKLRTLAEPRSKPDREALLVLGQLLAEQNLLPGPDPELVLLSRESPEGKPPRIVPSAGEKKAPALEQLLNGMALPSARAPPFPDGPLYRLEEAEASLQRVDPGPISGRGSVAGGAGDPDCPGDGLAWRLVHLAQNPDLEPGGPVGLASSDQGGEPVPVLPAGRDFFFAMEPPREEVPFNGLLFSPTWTPNGENCVGRSCPGSPLLGPLDLAPQVGKGGVDLFPAFCASTDLGPHLELGEAERHPGEESPGSPEDSSRLRAVFDALDGDGDGFVRIEEFIQFATVYGAEQVIPEPQINVP
ncbi:UNVERIFIED_CONTAM: hypothetical protein K2H54_014745 [Gekko kuhli]